LGQQLSLKMPGLPAKSSSAKPAKNKETKAPWPWSDCETYLRRNVRTKKEHKCCRCSGVILKGFRAMVTVDKDDRGKVDFQHSTFQYWHLDKSCNESGTV